MLIHVKLLAVRISPVSKRNSSGNAFAMLLQYRTHLGHSLSRDVQMKLMVLLGF